MSCLLVSVVVCQFLLVSVVVCQFLCKVMYMFVKTVVMLTFDGSCFFVCCDIITNYIQN